MKTASDKFRAWNKAGGQVLPGLVTRRENERALFFARVMATPAVFDFRDARRIVNGLDRADDIAAYARLFRLALKVAPNPSAVAPGAPGVPPLPPMRVCRRRHHSRPQKAFRRDWSQHGRAPSKSEVFVKIL